MINYLEIAKEKQKVSQNGLAKLLGISSAAISKIANGGTMSDETIVKLARLCNEKPEKVLSEYELQKQLKPEVKLMWERIRGHAAVIMISVISTLFLTGNKVLYILCQIMKEQKNNIIDS